jgi:hypothetical protein
MPPPSLPPRILLVMPDQWPRALLRAALREAGYDASGTRTLRMARHLAGPEEGRGPVGLVVLSRDAVAGVDRPHLDELRTLTGAPVVLLAPALREVPDGPWAQVIQRPVSIGELVQAVERLLPLPAEARKPVD